MMSPEDQFICLAVHLHINQADREQLQLLASKKMNWKLISQKSRRHGIVPFLYFCLKENNSLGVLPEEVRILFKKQFYTSTLLNRTFLDYVEEIPDFMSNEKVVLIKGAALNLDFYPNIGLRSMGDIDFLIAKDRRDEVLAKMITGGWKVGEEYLFRSKYHKEIFDRAHKTMPYMYKGDYEFFVDIHWKLFNGEKDDVIAKQAVDSAVQIKHNLYRLSNEMMLVHLSSNFAADFKGGVKLRSLCDIREILEQWKIDWNKVSSICAHSVLLQKSLSLSLNCVKWIFGAEIPSQYLIEAIQQMPASIDELSKNKLREGESLHLAYTFPEARKRMRYHFRTLFPEREWLKLMYRDSNIALIRYWAYALLRYVFKRELKYKDVRRLNRSEIREAHLVRSKK